MSLGYDRNEGCATKPQTVRRLPSSAFILSLQSWVTKWPPQQNPAVPIGWSLPSLALSALTTLHHKNQPIVSNTREVDGGGEALTKLVNPWSSYGRAVVKHKLFSVSERHGELYGLLYIQERTSESRTPNEQPCRAGSRDQ